jgi:hypothetical protein
MYIETFELKITILIKKIKKDKEQKQQRYILFITGNFNFKTIYNYLSNKIHSNTFTLLHILINIIILVFIVRYWYHNGFLSPDMMTVFVAVDKCCKENGCLQVKVFE